MGANPRVVKAFRAMKALGISEKQVKPVLKKMLKLYDKNWELIEEENYRALADAIFEDQDCKVSEDNGDATEGIHEEESQIPDEPERPLKRLRRGHDGQASTSVNYCDRGLSGTPLRKPKVDGEARSGMKSQQQSPDMRSSLPMAISPQSLQNVSPGCLAVQEQSNPSDLSDSDRTLPSDSLSPHRQHSYKGKKPLLPEVAPLQKRPNLKVPPQSVLFKEPLVQPGIVLLPKEKGPDTHALIKPKDEPFTDDLPFDGIPQPIAIIRPDTASREDSFIPRVPSPKQGLQKPSASKCVAEDRDGNIQVLQSQTRANCELATFPEEPPTNLVIASSESGEEKVMDVTPALDLLKKFDGVVANGSVDACFFDGVASFQIPRPLQPLNGSFDMQLSKELTANGCSARGKEKEFSDADSGSWIVVPQCQLTPDEFRSLHYLTDISKGEEMVEIPWLNELNSQFPPSFNYIPRNHIFQNACVKFTPSQIRAENCCSTCIGDCLSSSTPCVCSSETEYGFAYNLEGLLKEDFLEDCISLIRDPQQQCFLYCRDCPLERSKNDEILEPCKGHLKRKYITECWSKCGCHKQCGNRIVQRGIRSKLQVFLTPEGKGWGLRTLEKLRKGAFVCEYVGEILTNKELYERKMQRNSSMIEKHAYLVLLDANWCLKEPVKDEEALCLDATFYGNVARFINHRCLDANMIEIPVKIEAHDHHYYHLAFFTTREVDALEELTWDYGIDFDDNDHPVEVFHCQCGSKFCRNMKRSNRSKLAVR